MRIMSKKIVSKYSWITGIPVPSNFNIIGAFRGDCNDSVRKHIKLLKWEPSTRRNCAAQTYSTNSQNIAAYIKAPSALRTGCFNRCGQTTLQVVLYSYLSIFTPRLLLHGEYTFFPETFLKLRTSKPYTEIFLRPDIVLDTLFAPLIVRYL